MDPLLLQEATRETPVAEPMTVLKSLKSELDGLRRQRALNRFKTRNTTTGTSSAKVIIPEERLRIVALDISDELKQLHMRDQAHGNLSPSTIGFDTDGRATLVPVQRKDHDIRYRAPEAMNAIIEDVDTKSDVYSFALVLWEVATREVPYESILGKTSQAQTRSSCLHQRQQLIEQVGRKNIRPKLSKVPQRALRKLLKQCWDPNPDARPTLTRVWYTLHHEIFAESVGTCSSDTSHRASSKALEARILPYFVATNTRLTSACNNKTIPPVRRESIPVFKREGRGPSVQTSIGWDLSKRTELTMAPGEGDDESTYSDDYDHQRDDMHSPYAVHLH
jgi:serine/threonine protein kinase